MQIHSDFEDFISLLNKHKADYLIVGSFALFFYGQPRATGDIDIWIRPEMENAEKVLSVIKEFGFSSLELTSQDLFSGDEIQLGYPPVRIDLLTILDGVTTQEIWESRVAGKLGKNNVNFIGKEVYIKNKKTLGRNKDLADLDLLNGK
ncbi:MAG: hypothetical protein JW864_17980 [Spirochaetes bacterium]|nr:hypothetical protein [Spirochaetota bacterium]